ncbi:response regulator [Candidatus Gromoviella agglomerans]|uniref:ATP-binding response regulator n=1 Tax=Candidatus Gromoviella agglomerans TaxID=2806609 RepID=UPI001E5051BC|nr:response regulator [Candidatus Gromoviella agglomerans]UFX98140.1 Sensor histidine kinase/response regulator domain protein [Candidatus Gromoviella agglomerans]
MQLKSPNERFLELTLAKCPVEIAFFDADKQAFFPKNSIWNSQEDYDLESFSRKFISNEDQSKFIETYEKAMYGHNIHIEIHVKKFGLQEAFFSSLDSRNGVFVYIFQSKNWMTKFNNIPFMALDKSNNIQYISKQLLHDIDSPQQTIIGRNVSLIINADKIHNEHVVEIKKKNNQTLQMKLLIDESHSLKIIVMIKMPDVPHISSIIKNTDALKLIPVPYIIVDEFGRIEWFNNKFAEDVAPKGEKIFQRMIGSWLKCSDKDKLTELLEKEESFRLYTKDKTFEVHFHRVNKDEKKIYYTLMVIDITLLEQREKKIMEAQKFQTVGKIASNITHDFNNILTALRGICDIMINNKEQVQSNEEDLLNMSESIARASKLVRSILSFSKENSTSFGEINLEKQIEDLSPLLQRLVGSKISIDVKHEQTNPIIKFDKNGLERIIINLVSNARDAMPNGGKISIGTKEITFNEQMKSKNCSIPKGKYKALYVQDNGCGMSQTIVNKIFQPFFSTKNENGTGLGLSNVLEILNDNNSYVIVDSELKKGSKFTIIFGNEQKHIYLHEEKPQIEVKRHIEHNKVNNIKKYAQGNEANIQTNHKQDEENSDFYQNLLRNLKILLVDDDDAVRTFTSRAIKMITPHVIEVNNGVSAIDMVKTQHFDIIATDVEMHEINGPELVIKVKKIQPNIRVLFLSGYDENAVNLNKKYEYKFLAKPFGLNELNKYILDIGLEIYKEQKSNKKISQK